MLGKCLNERKFSKWEKQSRNLSKLKLKKESFIDLWNVTMLFFSLFVCFCFGSSKWINTIWWCNVVWSAISSNQKITYTHIIWKDNWPWHKIQFEFYEIQNRIFFLYERNFQTFFYIYENIYVLLNFFLFLIWREKRD